MGKRVKQKTKFGLPIVLGVGLLGIGVVASAWLSFAPSQKVLGETTYGYGGNGYGYRYSVRYGFSYLDTNGSPIASPSIIKVLSIVPRSTIVKRGNLVRFSVSALDNNRRPVDVFYVVWPLQPFGVPITYGAKEASYRVIKTARAGKYLVKPTVYYLSRGVVKSITTQAEVTVR